MKKIVFWKIVLVCACMFSFNACAGMEENGDNIDQSEQSVIQSSSIERAIQIKPKDIEVKMENTEPETLPAEPQWKVYICPDTPQPYIPVLMQYEQFMNADNQDRNDEVVLAKLWGGEWKDLYDEWCGPLASIQSWNKEEEIADVFHYALADLTGDGFPELILAYRDTPVVIYNYSEAKGIGKECATCYYTMTIYENGIVEYVSGGAYSSTTYLQFQNNVEDWVIQDIVACEGIWDSESQNWIDEKFYTGEWDESGRLADTISEEEYLQIQEKYVTEPMQFEWFPLIEQKSSISTPD